MNGPTRSLQENIRTNRHLVVCLAFGALAMIASLVVQFGWHLAPCSLCHWQRALAIGIVILSTVGYGTRWKRICLLVCQVMLALLVAVAAYHLLVQLGWIADPCRVSCQVSSLDDFRSILTRPVACATGPKVWGLPLPSYNAAIAFTTLLVTLWPEKGKARRGRIPTSLRSRGLDIKNS
ncbi:MAG: disulfide bond formation protein B [Candidatus Obscuribacterales bacterium]